MNRKNLGMIFTGIGACGVVATNVITANRTLKYKQIFDECEGDKAKAFAKTYWPSFVSGALTIGSIIAAEGVNLKEIGVLSGLCAYLYSQRNKIIGSIEAIAPNLSKEDLAVVNNAIDDVDEDKEAHIKYMVKAGPSVEETGRGDLLCFEGFSGRWFRSSEEDVKRAVSMFRRRFLNGEYLSLNDLYDLLGIERTRFGNTWGWANDPDYQDEPISIAYAVFNDFGNTNMAYDEDVLEIDISTPPMECWNEVGRRAFV